MTPEVVRENPAHPDQEVGRLHASGASEVADVVDAAQTACPSWAGRGVGERAGLLLSILPALEGDADATAELMARELGKVLPACRGELEFSRAWVGWAGEAAPRVLADRELDDDQGRLLLQPRPYGVVAAITPWNAPVALALLKVVPALIAGNTVVVKPSPLAPLAVDRTLHTIAASLPVGVLQVVHGGAETGAALAGNAHVAKVAFTGSAATGRAIALTAAAATTPLILELGGNDPAIVLDDARLDEAAVERLVLATYASGGQVCMAVKRLYVHESRYRELVSLFRAVADRVLVIGDPLVPGVTVGPLATRAAVDRVAALVENSRERGGDVLEIGTVLDAELFADGYFMRPSLVLGLDEGAPLVKQEQFGPTLPVMSFADEDEVIARANASELGLGASVWSADEDRAFALAQRLDAGFRFINTHNRTGLALRAPFGGVKGSGFGREYGDEGLREYVQTCVVHAPAAFREGARLTTT